MCWHLPLQRLAAVVGGALVGAAVAALLGVEAVGGCVPYVAQGVDVEGLLEVALTYAQRTLARGRTYIYICYAGFFHDVLELGLVVGGYLHDDAGVLGEEDLGDVLCLEVDEVDLEAAVGVGEAHLEEGGDETSGADVVAGEEELAAHTLLDGIEGVAEVFGVGAGGDVGAYVAVGLSVGAASEA